MAFRCLKRWAARCSTRSPWRSSATRLPNARRAPGRSVSGPVFGVALALGPVLGGAGHRRRLALDFPDQHPDRVDRLRLDPAVRARIEGGHPRRFDPWGQLLVIAFLATLIYGLIEAPSARLGIAADRGHVRDRGGRRGHAGAGRVAPHAAAAQGALLPQSPVQRGQLDRGAGVRGPGRLSVPQHAVPAGRPRLQRAARGPADAAHGRAHLRVRPDLRPAGGQPRPAAAAGAGGRGHHGGLRCC